jgi:hypothetical protein
MGSCESVNEREEKFVPGEQYFNKTQDININIVQNSNQSRDKIDLFFSLKDVVHPNLLHSFSITIINNVKLNIETYLGDLEDRSGKNIEYGKSFSVDYYFQREQALIIEPKINGKNNGYPKKIPLSQLITSPSNRINIMFEGIGLLTVNFKQVKIRKTPSENLMSSFQFTFNFTNKTLMSHIISGLFFVIYNTSYNQEKHALYKSQEFYANNNFVSSNIINLYLDSLSPDNNKNSLIYLGIFCPSLLYGKPIGYAQFTLNQLEYNLKMDQLTNIDIDSIKYGRLGVVQINYDETVKLTFVDYLSRGMQINLDIAIDYTASNNENPIPLHNIDGINKNDYEKAIESCGSILAFYDYDKLYPVYGFGGIPLGQSYSPNMVSHCFNINFQKDPNIKGIDNILRVYRESVGKVTLAAPTFFTPVLNKVINEIKYDLQNRQEENHYYVLLILTDGCINDMQQTCDKIVEASYLPLSIIIVGIGTADFSLMDILDGDKYPLKNSKGELRKRDIVQFVRFEDFKKHNAIDYGTDLTEEVLKEIPTQVEEYYEKCGKFYGNN